ncbi:hypothetical protein [Dyadobacter bucti]|uniref:hypothetical protein n=1 Tax=Dyadobacter bucti TaxID=2572203 RepID=UPI0011087780|nr:hypothetical protein [Dyadobacter bucti]
MGTLTLTSDFPGNKVEIRKDLIIALEDLENARIFSRNKTRIHIKGGVFKDVLEDIPKIKKLF